MKSNLIQLTTDYCCAAIIIYEDGTYRCAPILKNLRRIDTMLIKLTGIHDDKLGSKDAKRIEGKRIDNDEVWERKIFADARDLRGQLEEFGIGEVVNIKQVKNGKWWNISAFEKPTAELIEKVKSEGTGGKSYQNTTPSGGGAKSTWNGRTGEAYDRSAAIYLALDWMKHTYKDEQLDTKQVYAVADEVYNYIHNGVNPAIDPLEPPV